MKLWRINFRIFIPIIAFSALIFVVSFYVFKLVPFKPITINKDYSKLTPARDFTGTWIGKASFRNTDDPNNYCTFSGQTTITLKQSGNNLSGQFIHVIEDAIPSNENVSCIKSTEKTSISTTLNGSKIETFTVSADYGTFDGSVTSDTLTLNQTKIGSLKLLESIKLLKQ